MLLLEQAIQQSIHQYFKHGPRSNKKLIPLHTFINKSIQQHMNDTSLTYHSLPESEMSVKGRYYSKKVDICVHKCSKVLGMVSIKFIMSNYAQNANNYFETLVGELYNLTPIDIVKWYIVVVFDKIPYYDNKYNIKHYSEFKHMDRYNMLITDKVLECLSIVTMSNGMLLKHPNCFTSDQISQFDYNQFMIKSVGQHSFKASLDVFCKKLKHKLIS